MKVLYVVGSCLTKNTSANMSHNSYVQGLIENGCDVDIIMKNESWGMEDNALPYWIEPHYFKYNAISFSDKLRKLVARKEESVNDKLNSNKENIVKKEVSFSGKTFLKEILKKLFYFIFRPDSIYPLDKVWLHNASKFKSNICYDLVVSNSSPAASHKLVVLLSKKKKIHFKRWIQIWEDPWYYDLYGGNSEKIKKEEYYLLKEASEIYYVSPLTLEYQKKYYSDCADKMKCIPLPFLKIESGEECTEAVSFGYFGDFYSHTRNLLPFYHALCVSGNNGYIYGDTDLHLESTEKVEVSGRVTLDKLAKIQEKTGVLVHLCNLRGGQIPGKIYHYSATNKPILFILDGTVEEQKIIKKYFEKFDRYYFCINKEEDILAAIKEISTHYKKYKGSVVEDFSPKRVVEKLLEI